MKKGPKQFVWTEKMVRDRTTEDGACWIWKYSTNSAGYPMTRIDGKSSVIGAWLYHHLNGTTPDRVHVIASSCGNKLCVSPKCLVRITRSEQQKGANRNTLQMSLREREKAIRRGWAKLDMEKAREIRRSDLPHKALAEKYGVTVEAIQKVRRGVNWKDGAANSSVFNWRPAA